jgi:hypothetical protein
MNTTDCPAFDHELARVRRVARRFRCPRFSGGAVVLALPVFAAASAPAAPAVNLFWDANAAGGGSDGSGTWRDPNKWWNGAADQNWADGNNVLIGTNTPGTYSVVLDRPVVSTNVTIRTNFYSYSGSTWTWSSLVLGAFSAVGRLPGGSIVFSGIHGPAGGSYHILSSTNVTLQPLSAWTSVVGGSFDALGSFGFTNGINPATPQVYYLLSVP